MTGRVLDASTGTPLAAASVSRAGAERALYTDDEGRFRLARATPGEVLEVQQLGYEPQRVSVQLGRTAPVVVQLTPRPAELQRLALLEGSFRERRASVRVSVQALDRQALVKPYGRNACAPGESWGWCGVPDMRRYLARYALIRKGMNPGAEQGGGARGAPSYSPTECGYGLGREGRGVWGCSYSHAYGFGAGALPGPGRPAYRTIWIDGRQSTWHELMRLRPEQLFMLEVYDRGMMIRAYTQDWALSGASLEPLPPS